MGFIHDKLDIKFLILYLMARVAGPVDFTILADLTFCDDGVESVSYTHLDVYKRQAQSRGHSMCQRKNFSRYRKNQN